MKKEFESVYVELIRLSSIDTLSTSVTDDAGSESGGGGTGDGMD